MDNTIDFIPKGGSSLTSVLSEHLALAKTGDITTVAMVALHSNGDLTTFIYKTDDFFKMLGGIEHLKMRMCAGKMGLLD